MSPNERVLAEIRRDPGFALGGFNDRTFGGHVAKVLPGEFYVTDDDEGITTTLGSCVAACIRDPRLGIGGMNHFMLPDNDNADPLAGSARYGTHAMEMLINSLIKLGCRRSHLEAKVFGGGSVLSNLTHSQVGERNAQFVMDFLRREHIPVSARDLGDVHPRKVYYFPKTGKVMVKRLTASDNRLLETESAYRKRIAAKKVVAGEVELF
jgi:chemotaxis protein CheD